MAIEAYQEYPRKVGKGAALKAIRKAIISLADKRFDGDRVAAKNWLKERVVAFAHSALGLRPDKEHTPHPATWFNSTRYDDDESEWTHVGSSSQKKSNARTESFAPSDGFDDVLSRPSPVWMKGGLQCP
jgi:hypothetical protein